MTTVVAGATKETAGLPDLFVYCDDNITDWFFAEVKGPNDDIDPKQEEKSELLDQAAGRNVVRLIEVIREPSASFRHPPVNRFANG